LKWKIFQEALKKKKKREREISHEKIPVAMAPFSSDFQCSATSFARGSSGLGAERSA
jgi:hypothetical protein